MYTIFVKDWLDSGNTCTIISSSDKDNIELFCENLDIKYVKKTRLNLFGFEPSVYRILNKKYFKDFDVIHIHGFHTGFSLEFALFFKLNNIKYIFSPHYHESGHKEVTTLLFPFYKIIASTIFSWSSYIIYNSNWEKRLILNDFKINDNKLLSLSPGVEKIDIVNKKIHPSDTIMLLYVGGLRVYKNIDKIIETLNILVNTNNNNNYLLTIVGEGEDKDRLINIVKKLNIENKIIWKSNLTDLELENQYKEAHILFLLSGAEAYGLVVAEALSKGTPCIITMQMSLSEFIDEPGCFLVEYPPNPIKVANVVKQLVKDNPNVGPFSNKIREWNQVVNDVIIIYNKFKN